MEFKGLFARDTAIVCVATFFIVGATTAGFKRVSGTVATSFDVPVRGITCLGFGSIKHEIPSYITIDQQLRRRLAVGGVGLGQNRTSAAMAGTQDGC